MKRTPWFPASVKPVHVGEYETRMWGAYDYTLPRLRLFGGRYFVGCFGLHPRDQWRGLTTPSGK